MADFWLYQWMDDYGVTSRAKAERLLRPGDGAVRRLLEIAEAAAVEWHELSPYQDTGSALLAGRGVDLSGDLDCCHEVCQITQVDALFGRALHYFDKLVISGPPAWRYIERIGAGNEDALHNLIEHVAALLYIRDIGADTFVTFIQKPPVCAEHYRQNAREVGIEEVIDRARPWINKLEETGDIVDLRPHDDHWDFQFHHSSLEHNAWGTVAPDADGGEPAPHDIAEAVFAEYAAHLVSDVAASRMLRLPLGASVELHEDVLARQSAASPTTEDVAFDLRLPVVTDIPVRDVVRLRHDESEYFGAFREALKTAIEERLTNESSQAVAERVATEVLTPALVDIDRRLRVAEGVLARKSAMSLGVGFAVATIGLITGVPLVSGAGVVAMGSTLPVAHKYIEARGAIESDDMYWLWRLTRR